MRTATMPPGLTQRKGRLTLGAAQYSTDTMNIISRTRTGHLTMFHRVTAVGPAPMKFPTHWATPPLRMTASALIATSVSRSRVMPTRTGRVFQNGRPSRMSYTMLAARMNAAT